MRAFLNALHLVSVVSLLLFLVLFLQHNAAGLTNLPLICFVAAVYFALFTYVHVTAFQHANKKTYLKTAPIEHPHNNLRHSNPIQLISSVVLIISLVFITLDNLVFDYFQAITTSEPVIYAWLICWVSTLFIMLSSLVNFQDLTTKSNHLKVGVIALLGLPTMMLVNTITSPVVSTKALLHQNLFVGGENGYKVYRIPAIQTIAKGQVLANGKVLKNERIIAIVEARKDAALDTGAIDLVQKVSDDGGLNWSQQQVICQYKNASGHGKCGNATPLIDRVTGTVYMAFNLSGLPKNLPEGQRHHTAHIMSSVDGGITWQDDKIVDLPNSVFGPGHGIQKQSAPFKNRLVIPFNTSVGSQGSSVALLSDDHGKTWFQGKPLGTGNENEITELPNGNLIMATRHIAPVGSPPTPNGRLFSTSSDGGNTWSTPYLSTDLVTPICQASLITLKNNKGLLFSNPADNSSRVQLTLSHSLDNGLTWQPKTLVFSGPAGYSQIAELSDNSIVVLYESGKLSYSQNISLTKLPINVVLD